MGKEELISFMNSSPILPLAYHIESNTISNIYETNRNSVDYFIGKKYSAIQGQTKEQFSSA